MRKTKRAAVMGGVAQRRMLLRLYRRVYDIFPNAPLAGEGLYRSADIRWQVEKSDLLSRPSAREKESYLRQGINEDGMKLVMKKFPGTKWAHLAAFHLIDNKLCGDWQGASKCPDKEADIYEKYWKERPDSPSAPEALYESAWRRAALIEIYKTEEQPKKSEQAKKPGHRPRSATDLAISAERLVFARADPAVSGAGGCTNVWEHRSVALVSAV